MKLAPILAVIAIGLTACSASDEPATEGSPTVVPPSPRTIELAGTEVDVHSPPAGAGATPVVVMLHGTEGDRTRMNPLAAAVAADGALVYVPSWPVIDQVAEFPEDAGDEPFRLQTEAVVCTLRAIRRSASDLGGDPADLTVVGHSGGGMIGARVSLVDEPPWPGIDCDADVDHRPSRFIGLAGDYEGWYQYATTYPDLYAPYDLLATEPTNTDLEMWLVHGHNDTTVPLYVSDELLAHVRSAGIRAQLITADWDHTAPLDPDAAAGRYTADFISAVVHDAPDESWTRTDTDATLSFEGQDRCTYSGPSTWPTAETFVLGLENPENVDMWFALVSVRPGDGPAPAKLLQGGGELGVDNPEWVDFGGFVAVEPRSTGLLRFVFAESDQRFVFYCHPDPEADHPWANWMFPAGLLTPEGLQP